MCVFVCVGARINSSGICGALLVADPLDACSSLVSSVFQFDHVKFTLIVRGNCSFLEKVRNAQLAGFDGAIVFDDQVEKNLISSKHFYVIDLLLFCFFMGFRAITVLSFDVPEPSSEGIRCARALFSNSYTKIRRLIRLVKKFSCLLYLYMFKT